ncbi:MAG: YihA family ribosome biogenesis GTP-binding protein [Alphaproteobacteria bacterium]|nr:YihA family ribosome biogenesis GTP-binding protein [Alphaproteobacteria bacterium]
MKLKDFYKNKPIFIGSFPDVNKIPFSNQKEIAFIGRSNVGKSSLINAIFSSPNLAKTSATPGRTQQLNFFNMQDILMIVDLPGYGFAKAPRDVVKNWNDNVNTYLKGRVQLRRVFLLIDCRQGLKQVDLDMMGMLDASAVNYQITLTKLDKISQSEAQKIKSDIEAIYKNHPAMHPIILSTSSEKNIGLDEIRGEIFDLIK